MLDCTYDIAAFYMCTSFTSVYIGLRFVKPYYFSFTSHAKGRWVGSRVYDVFCREFQAERPEYYVRYYHYSAMWTP